MISTNGDSAVRLTAGPERPASPERHEAAGFTLVEMLVVVAILVAAAGVVLMASGGILSSAQAGATGSTLVALRDAVLGNTAGAGYLADVGGDPLSVADLLRRRLAPTEVPAFDPASRRGWRGPYVRSSGGRYAVDSARGFSAAYGADGDPAVLDSWNSPVVLQIPSDPRYTRLVSAGPDRILETPSATSVPATSQCGDDVVLYLHVADERP